MDKTRFSLLLLEPGEIYFEDFSASLNYDDCPETDFEETKIYGRLKLCSKSLVFDPADFSQPILKIQYKNCIDICNVIRNWEGGDNVLVVECDYYAEMLTGNVISPYLFKSEKKKFLFTLNYAKADDCLPQIQQLRRASTLLPAEQNAMIGTIAFSKHSRISFKPMWLEDMFEKILVDIQGSKISPLIVNPGRIVLTSARLYFQPFNNIETHPVLKINLKEMSRMICRRFLLKQVGIEIIYQNNNNNLTAAIYLVLNSKEERDYLYKSILEQSAVSLTNEEQDSMTLQWQNRVISNYDYLLYLNCLADRSFNDLTQYPVFPWIVSDYTSETLDLNNSKVFRDLSKPIGAINRERFKKLKIRYDEMASPKFLYGSHYSAPGFVLFYLVRKYPHYMLCLQNGRFDHPDRMFNSINDIWKNVMVNMSDFKELVPEFYDVDKSGDFLVNNYGINFGVRHDGSLIDDVRLPPWSRDHCDFVRKLREALECDYVSQNIHKWIDLIFGCKQRGEAAVAADNVFYHLCYEGAVDLDQVRNSNDRHALEVQIMEFGQIPKQLFTVPHPPRYTTIPQHVLNPHGPANSVGLTKENRVDDKKTMTEIGQHKSFVSFVVFSPDESLAVSVGSDSFIKVYSVIDKKLIRNYNVNQGTLSSCVVLQDNRTVILGSWNNNIVIYDLEYGKIIDCLQAHDNAVSCLTYGHRSKYLASGSWDYTVKIWQTDLEKNKWKNLRLASVHAQFDCDEQITCLSFNCDNTLITGGSNDGMVRVWSMNDRTIKYGLQLFDSQVTGVSFSSDDSQFISCCLGGVFKVVNVPNVMEVCCKVLDVPLTCLSWNGVVLVMGSSTGELIFYDMLHVKPGQVVKVMKESVSCVKLSTSGHIVMAGCSNKQVVLVS